MTARPRHPSSLMLRRALPASSRRCEDTPSRSSNGGQAQCRTTLSGSKRYVVLHSLPHFPDFPDQVVHLIGVGNEIDIRGVHHQQWGFVVLKKVVSIRLREPLHVLWSNAPFVIPIALAEPRQQ